MDGKLVIGILHTCRRLKNGWWEVGIKDMTFYATICYPKFNPNKPLIKWNDCAVGKEEQQLPYLLYLQGGPGFECSRPTEASGWIHKACEEFRVVLMDQVWMMDIVIVL